MKKTSFINDKTKFSDEEKILHHLLHEKMAEYDRRRKKLFFLLGAALLLVFAGIIILKAAYVSNSIGIIFLAGGVIGIGVYLFLNKSNSIRPIINKLGVVYLPVTKMPIQNGSILIDRSGLVNPTGFDFNSLESEDITIVDGLLRQLKKNIAEMPLILSPGKNIRITGKDPNFRKENIKIYTEESGFIQLNELLCDAFTRRKQFSVDLNAIKFDRDLYHFIKDLGADPGKVFEKISIDKLDDDMDLINGVVEMYQDKKEAEIDIDELCEQIYSLLGRILPCHDYSVHNSLNNIMVPATYRQTNLIERASYNYYCPECNAELIRKLLAGVYAHNSSSDNRVDMPVNTRMKMVDFDHDIWKCPLCLTVTSNPFPRHKMEDELFTPVYDKLYEEHFVERLKIYNNINDQKRSYAEKAETNFHEVFRETRTKVDNIKSRIRSVNAEIEADAAAIASLNAVITKQKMIEAQRSREIQAETEFYKKEIAEDSRRSQAAIDEAVSRAKSEIQRATSKYAYLEREDQSRRDKVQKEIAESSRQTAESNEDIIRVLTGKKIKNKY